MHPEDAPADQEEAATASELWRAVAGLPEKQREAVQVLIDELGNVFAACAISGHPALTRVCEEAARSAKFTPTKLSGKPVQVIGLITYNFVAQ